MGKIIVITGASAGIGLSLAKMLDNGENKIYAASRKGETGFVGKNIEPVSLDVNNEQSLNAFAAKIADENGRVDVLVCNAGNGIGGSVEDMKMDEIRYQMETNFFGAVNTIKAFLPLMRRQNFGKIIVTGSVAGVVPIPFQSVYSASKAAVMTFTDALSLELKPYNIQCCCILPGDTKTNFTAARKIAANAENTASPYLEKFKNSIAKMEKDEQNGAPPEKVAQQIVNQINKKTMKKRVVPGLDYKLICWAFGWLPQRLKLWIVGMLYA